MNEFPRDLPPASSYDGALFGWSGTLCHTARNQAIAWQNALMALGAPIALGSGQLDEKRFTHDLAGLSGHDLAVTLAREFSVDPQSLLAAATYAKFNLFTGWDPVEPVVDFAFVCRAAGKPTMIVTSEAAECVEHALVASALLRNRLEPRIRIIDPRDVEPWRGKPKPDTYLLAAITLGMDRERLITVDCDDQALKAAEAAGIRAFKFSAQP